MCFKSNVKTCKRDMNLSCGNKLHILPNTKVSTAKDHGKNYIKVTPPLVHHLLRNCLFSHVCPCTYTLFVAGLELFLVLMQHMTDNDSLFKIYSTVGKVLCSLAQKLHH